MKSACLIAFVFAVFECSAAGLKGAMELIRKNFGGASIQRAEGALVLYEPSGRVVHGKAVVHVYAEKGKWRLDYLGPNKRFSALVDKDTISIKDGKKELQKSAIDDSKLLRVFGEFLELLKGPDRLKEGILQLGFKWETQSRPDGIVHRMLPHTDLLRLAYLQFDYDLSERARAVTAFVNDPRQGFVFEITKLSQQPVMKSARIFDFEQKMEISYEKTELFIDRSFMKKAAPRREGVQTPRK